MEIESKLHNLFNQTFTVLCTFNFNIDIEPVKFNPQNCHYTKLKFLYTISELYSKENTREQKIFCMTEG